MARTPKETTTLMQRGLSHPSTTNTIEQLLDDDAEIGKVTISDNETLKKKRKKKGGIEGN